MTTPTRIVLNRIGQEQVICHFDVPQQLNDPMFPIPGTHQVDLTKDVYDKLSTPRAMLGFLRAAMVDQRKIALAAVIARRIDKLDAEEKVEQEYRALDILVGEAGERPSEAQQAAIDAAASKIAAAVLSIESIGTEIFLLEAGLP